MSNSVRPHRWQPTRLLCPWDSPGKNIGVGYHFLLQCTLVRSYKNIKRQRNNFAVLKMSHCRQSSKLKPPQGRQPRRIIKVYLPWKVISWKTLIDLLKYMEKTAKLTIIAKQELAQEGRNIDIMQLSSVGFPGWLSGEESACQTGDTGLILGSGRFLGEGSGNPLQYSCLENCMGR